jgi:hypothetical protein
MVCLDRRAKLALDLAVGLALYSIKYSECFEHRMDGGSAMVKFRSESLTTCRVAAPGCPLCLRTRRMGDRKRQGPSLPDHHPQNAGRFRGLLRHPVRGVPFAWLESAARRGDPRDRRAVGRTLPGDLELRRRPPPLPDITKASKGRPGRDFCGRPGGPGSISTTPTLFAQIARAMSGSETLRI